MARAKPPENLTPRAEVKKPPAAEPTALPPATPTAVLGTGWLFTATLWVFFFLILIAYEGYGFFKGLLRF